MITRALSVCVVLLAGQAADEGRFYQDLKNGQELLPDLIFTGPVAGVAVPEAEGLRLTLPAKRQNKAPVGLHSTFEIAGDCEVTGSYDLLAADAPRNKFNFVGVNLYAPQGPVRHVKFGRYNTLDRGHVYMAQVSERDNPNKNPQTVTKVFPTTAQAGQLRLIRKGTTVTFAVKDSTTADGFKELWQEEFNAGPLGPLRFVLTTNGEAVAADARLIDLRVQSSSPLGPLVARADPPNVASPRRGLRWILLAVLLAMAVAIGLVLWFKRPS